MQDVNKSDHKNHQECSLSEDTANMVKHRKSTTKNQKSGKCKRMLNSFFDGKSSQDSITNTSIADYYKLVAFLRTLFNLKKFRYWI